MSGFYLTSTTLKTGVAAAQESVSLFDGIFGSNETSRALCKSSVAETPSGRYAMRDTNFMVVPFLLNSEHHYPAASRVWPRRSVRPA